MFGTHAFGEAMFADQADRDMSIPFSLHTPWILQVRTREGVMLHRLDGWFNCQEERKINQPGTLSFSIPLEHPAVQTGELAGPNEIWTVDGAGIVQHKYVIQEERARLDLSGNTYNIRASGYLKFLADERGNMPLSGAVDVEDVINQVIIQFDGTPEITKGFLEPAIASAAVDLGDVNFQSLLSVLNTVRKSGIGGWFEVDNERSINWRSLTTAFPEQVFQLPDNLTGYEEKTQRGEIFNRVFATGRVVGTGNDKTKVELPAPGYVQDQTSIDTYGRRSKTLSSPIIATQAQLTAFAQSFLDDHKDPPVQRTLPSIDLSQLQQDPDNATTRIDSVVRLSAPVTLKPPVEIPGSPVPFNVNIVGFTRTLDDPLAVTIEFDEEEVDIFRRLVQAIQEEGPTNILNVINQDVEDLWQSLNQNIDDILQIIDDLDIPDTFLDLDDTPGSYSAGAIYQANVAENGLSALNLGSPGDILHVGSAGNALGYLGIGGAGQLLTPNTEEDELEWVDSPYVPLVTGANQAALGTPAQVSFGLITASGDNRFMFWDADAVVSQVNNAWRDVNSYGKGAE